MCSINGIVNMLKDTNWSALRVQVDIWEARSDAILECNNIFWAK